MLRHHRLTTILITTLLISQATGASGQQLGKGGGAASGSAGPGGAQGENAQLEKCDSPKGTLALNEPQSEAISELRSLGLTTPLPLIRLIVQQSNCFQLVERGSAFQQNILQERALAEGGLLQSTSNMGKGQIATADFVLTPDVVYKSRNTSGAGAALGGLFGPLGAAVGGGFKTRAAETVLTLVDVRSSIQVASASGSARKKDFSFGALGFGGGVGGGAGAYENTPEGKIIAASFLDNWNQIVRSIKDQPSLIAPTSQSSQVNAAASIQATPFGSGDVLVPKIAGAKVLSAPKEGATALAALSKGEEVIYEGTEQDGYLKVTTTKGSGWVRKVLFQKP
jgi:hypothetical protein